MTMSINRNTRMSLALLSAVLSTAALGATPATAGTDAACRLAEGTSWMAIETVASRLTAQGYSVHGIERDHGCYEVKATDRAGQRVELTLHPATGAILASERKTRDHDDRDDR